MPLTIPQSMLSLSSVFVPMRALSSVLGFGVTLVEVISNLERGEAARKKRVDLEDRGHA